ncbi:MAG TPA: isoprenylcysteine carboxylmethyltransferase family protein [Candidatus Acidoferrum sp.]|nr:isoprenylcysteine carboxylmethyltransferase family protein [Candidatus Acidoferrum sp.]
MAGAIRLRLETNRQAKARRSGQRRKDVVEGHLKCSGGNMLGIETIRVFSLVFFVSLVVGFAFGGFFGRKRRDLGPAKASNESNFVLLYHVWHILIVFPLFFILVGIAMPGWVFGTVLNLSFQGAEYLQVLSVPLLLIAITLLDWSARALGQFMDTHIQVLQKHELVTSGPYSRIRHPSYTSAMIFFLANTLLYLNIIMLIAFLAVVAIVYKRAILEEELLASEDGFGQEYRDYMKRTGRFLPRL